MTIETHQNSPDLYRVYENNTYLASLDTRSFNYFENSIARLAGTRFRKAKMWGHKLAQHFISNLRQEYFALIPFCYVWALKSGHLEVVELFERKIFPHIAHKISIGVGQRWLFVFDKMIYPEHRFEILNNWIKQERPMTQHDRIERWIALRGLLLKLADLPASLSDSALALYIDFIKNPQNEDIERIFGEAIEKDFLQAHHCRFEAISKSKADAPNEESKFFIDSWLMRRYAIDQVFPRDSIFLAIGFVILYFLIVSFAILSPKSETPIIFTPFSFIALVGFFLMIWKNDGWRMGKIIWGTAIGWFFVFSAVLADLIYQGWPKEKPQILIFERLELFSVFVLFCGIFALIIFKEVDEANIKPLRKKIKRLCLVSIFAIYFGFIEGCLLITLITWYFPKTFVWYNRWVSTILALGTVQAMAIGIITQLIWERSRLTEVIRK